MGVPGLTTFIDAHKHQLLVDHSLHGTRVLIDGNNLYHFLYYYYHVRHECGGDYDRFRTACAAFFTALRDCHVAPCVVFDGAHHEDGRKFRTSLGRATERIHLAGFLSVGNRAKILPILACETFRGVLDEMSVEHVTCYLEADEQIAGLAQKWRCPVMSNDSDFFVYDLPGGVILLDYMNLAVKQTNGLRSCEQCRISNSTEQLVVQKHLCVQMFYLDRLLAITRIKDRLIVPLAATLIGNDVVSKRHFEPFYAKVKLSKEPSSRQGARAGVVASLFDWLARTDGLNDAIGQVLSFLSEDKRDSVKLLISASIESYATPQCAIKDLFTDDASPRLIQGSLQNASRIPAPVAFGGYALPEWFLEHVRAGSVPACALSAVTRRKVILLAQIETMNEPSAYDCSRHLRACFYSILLNLDRDAQENQLGTSFVMEHDREQKVMKSKKVKVVDEVAVGVSVPSLHDVPGFSAQHRYALIVAALSGTSLSESRRREFISDLPVDLQLIVLVIFYWAIHARPKVNSLHVRALLICCLSLGAFDQWIVSSAGNDCQSSVVSLAEKKVMLSKEAVSMTRQNTNEHTTIQEADEGKFDVSIQLSQIKTTLMNKFATTPRVNKANLFDGVVVHAFSQFQTCLQATIHLTQLLLLPSMALLNPASMVNGTFLYNLVRELEIRVDADLFLEQLLGRGSRLTDRFKHVCGVVDSLLPNGSLRSVSIGGAGKRSKKVKAKSSVSVVPSDDCENLSLDENVEEIEDRLKAKVDLDNKFSCLSMCDD